MATVLPPAVHPLLSTDSTDRFCATCMKSASELEKNDIRIKLCACKIIRYCSEECRRKDWSRHKIECKSKTTKKEAACPLEKKASSENSKKSAGISWSLLKEKLDESAIQAGKIPISNEEYQGMVRATLQLSQDLMNGKITLNKLGTYNSPVIQGLNQSLSQLSSSRKSGD